MSESFFTFKTQLKVISDLLSDQKSKLESSPLIFKSSSSLFLDQTYYYFQAYLLLYPYSSTEYQYLDYYQDQVLTLLQRQYLSYSEFLNFLEHLSNIFQNKVIELGG